MDVQLHRSEGTLPDQGSRGSGGGRLRRKRKPGGTTEWAGEVLGEWQRTELRIARGFFECRGLSAEQLEDIYQETAVVLLGRSYQSEEHLRNTLRKALKNRAMNFHRDERRRDEILTGNAPSLPVITVEDQDGPEGVALIHEDRLIVTEFLTELTALEQRVFWLLAEQMKYRAIASVLGVEINQARNAARSCEQKRERFQLLYDTGRLCRFRASTIEALQAGEATSEELARRAVAHVAACSSCRSEHGTNAMRLRRSFQGQAAALLPVPALLGHLSWLTRLDVRVRTVQQRLMPDGLPFGQGGVRDGATGLLVGGGVAAKVAAGLATVALLAGGTIGATHVLEHGAAPRHPSSHNAAGLQAREILSHTAAPPLLPQAASRVQEAPRASPPVRHSAPGHVVPSVQRSRESAPGAQREPGGFAYLGVPTGTGSSRPPEAAHAAAHSNGGQFSP